MRTASHLFLLGWRCKLLVPLSQKVLLQQLHHHQTSCRLHRFLSLPSLLVSFFTQPDFLTFSPKWSIHEPPLFDSVQLSPFFSQVALRLSLPFPFFSQALKTPTCWKPLSLSVFLSLSPLPTIGRFSLFSLENLRIFLLFSAQFILLNFQLPPILYFSFISHLIFHSFHCSPFSKYHHLNHHHGKMVMSATHFNSFFHLEIVSYPSKGNA